MDVARIRDGIVVNIESASQEWLEANSNGGDFIFVPFTEENPAVIGLGWNEVDGFEQDEIVALPAPNGE